MPCSVSRYRQREKHKQSMIMVTWYWFGNDDNVNSLDRRRLLIWLSDILSHVQVKVWRVLASCLKSLHDKLQTLKFLEINPSMSQFERLFITKRCIDPKKSCWYRYQHPTWIAQYSNKIKSFKTHDRVWNIYDCYSYRQTITSVLFFL